MRRAPPAANLVRRNECRAVPPADVPDCIRAAVRESGLRRGSSGRRARRTSRLPCSARPAMKISVGLPVVGRAPFGSRRARFLRRALALGGWRRIARSSRDEKCKPAAPHDAARARHPCVPLGREDRSVAHDVRGCRNAQRHQPPHSSPHRGRCACRAAVVPGAPFQIRTSDLDRDRGQAAAIARTARPYRVDADEQIPMNCKCPLPGRTGTPEPVHQKRKSRARDLQHQAAAQLRPRPQCRLVAARGASQIAQLDEAGRQQHLGTLRSHPCNRPRLAAAPRSLVPPARAAGVQALAGTELHYPRRRSLEPPQHVTPFIRFLLSPSSAHRLPPRRTRWQALLRSHARLRRTLRSYQSGLAQSARSSFLSTLFDAFTGSAATKRTARGTL